MRSFFRSEYAALFVGPTPAYSPHTHLHRSLLRKLPKIQSVSYGFDINREEIKQLGHEDLLTRKINLTVQEPLPGSNIDVNIEPVPVNFSFDYLPTCGLVEFLLNFNVVPGGEEAKNSFLTRHYGDQNFFLVLRSDRALDVSDLKWDDDYIGHYVLGIGNAFVTSYSVSANVGSPAVASISCQASNITLDEYKGDNYIPAIHLADGKYKEQHQYSFELDVMNNEYKNNIVLPNHIDLSIDDLNIGGQILSKENANAVGFSIDIDLSRRNLYGMGSMYPYDRKLDLPARGTLSLDIIDKNPQTGNLNQILKVDKPYKIQLDCKDNCNASKDFNETRALITYVVDNAVLKNQSSSLSVNDYIQTQLTFDFTVTRSNGFLISGACLENLCDANNDSIPEDARFSSNFYVMASITLDAWFSGTGASRR